MVITSVDRDDLRDGGSGHFVECIQRIRELSPSTQIEILTPDFRGRDDRALEILKAAPPDVMNHNLETAPRLYKGSASRLRLPVQPEPAQKFKELHPNVPTKSGIMVGLGETDEEILQVMRDMRAHNIDMLTIGQYLAPATTTCPCAATCTPPTFKMFEEEAPKMGFSHAAVGAMVRSSYHADQQAHAAGVKPGRSTTKPPCSPPPQMPCHCGATGLRPAATATITSRCSSAWKARWSWRLKAEGSAWPRGEGCVIRARRATRL